MAETTESTATSAEATPAAADVSEVSEETSEATAEGTPEQGASESDAAFQKRLAAHRFKLKADGRELELSAEEMQDLASKGVGFTKRMQALAAREKQIETAWRNFEHGLQTNPGEMLRRLKIDPLELAEREILEIARQKNLSPEEKARLALQAERDAIEAEREKLQNEKRQSSMTQTEAQIEQGLSAAFKKAGLPPTPERIRALVPHVIDEVIGMVEAGLWDVEKQGIPTEAIFESLQRLHGGLRKEIAEQHVGHLSSLEGEALLNAVGPDLLKKIRAADNERIATKSAPSRVAPGNATRKPAAVPEPRKRVTDFHSWQEAERARRGF